MRPKKNTLMKRRTLVFVLFSIIFASCSQEENYISYRDSGEINLTYIQENLIESTLLNVAYGDHPEQVFDIYLPQGRTTQKTKVLMVVHGGSWTSGDKSSLTNFVLDLKKRNPNHAIVNINYILGSETHYAFPNQLFDIKAAIKFLKDKKFEYHINPKIGIIGSSAGGHLALQYSYKYDKDNDIKFVGSLGGPTNFSDPSYNVDPASLLDLLTDKDYYESNTFNFNSYIDLLQTLSPTNYISEKSRPTIMFYGEQDMLVPFSNGTLLDEHLAESNIFKSFNIFQGGHGAWNAENYKEMLHSKLQTFINSHLFVSDK